MKNRKLALALALGIGLFSSKIFAGESVRELYNKDGIVLSFKGDESGKFKVIAENKSKKDMLNVKLVSEEIKGFKLVEGKELFLGDIKAGEKKVLDEKVKYEIEKEITEAIKKGKLVKTGVKGVYKLYIPITIAGMIGCVYLLVSKRKNKKKMLSLAVTASILASATILGNVNAKENYDHIENITGKLSINNAEYDYNGVLMWNDGKENPKDEDKVVIFEDEKLKEVILNLFKNNTGSDGFGDTISGEYEFKLSDPNYKLPQDATEIHESDMEKIEALALRGFTLDENFDVFPYEFKSLKGLETAKNLKQLTVSSGNIPQEGDEDFEKGIEYSKNSFSDLTPLAKLEKLEILRLSHNNIEDISPLKDLTGLKELYLSHNRIKDISSLEKLTSLESFDFSKNEVSNMDAVKNFKELKILTLIRNNVTDIEPIKDLVNINYLNLSKNKIMDINGLVNLNELEYLNLGGNKIENINSISGKVKLKHLILNNNKLSDKSLNKEILKDFKDLEEFNISGNEITDISFVSQYSNLKELLISNNKISNIDAVKNLTQLQQLRMENNNVRDFTVLKDLSSLNIIRLNNQVVDLSGDPALPVSEKIFETESIFTGLSNLTKKVKVSSDNENVKVEYNDKKLKITLNDNVTEELKKGEITLNLKYETEIDYQDITLNVKNLKLKFSENNKYAKIEDPLLLKVINKNLGKERADDQKVTVKEMESLKELSLFLDENGKPHFPIKLTKDEENSETKESILGKPQSLKGTKDFKFAVTRGIKSIKGLEYAKNLEKLKLNENEISDISPLKDLTKLEYLEIQRNRIVDLKPLENLKSLKFLKLYNNLIEDLTPLSGLTNLTGLDLHYNVTVEGDENNKKISKGITDISALKDLKNLEFLDISANRIEDVSILKDFSEIKDLDFSGNRVKNYTGLGDYIANRLAKALNEESPEGSMQFAGQTVSLGQTLDVNSNEISFDSPYTGIEELSDSIAKTFEAEGYNAFGSGKTDIEGIDAVYDKETKKVILKISDDVISENNGKEIDVKVTLTDMESAYSFAINNIKLKFNVVEEIVADEYKDFYFNLFNKYNKFYKKYENLTDEANKLFSETNKPKKDKVFTKEDMKMLKSFVVNDKNVTDKMIKSLRYAENLEKFGVELKNADLKRDVTNFNFLTKTPKLKEFIYQNQDYNKAKKEKFPTGVDFSKNILLEQVIISQTDLSNLFPFKSLKLKQLSLQDNNITNLFPIKDMDTLVRLDLDNNKISNLPDLSKMQNLVTLYLRDNAVSDISKLESLKNIEALHLRNNKITDISVLTKLPKLHRLYIDKNESLKNYMENVKKLNGMNTLFVDKISKEDFEWLKDFSVREAVDATEGEDKVRMFHFEKLEIPIEVKKSDIKDGFTEIENPLKDWDNNFISDSGDENGENKNSNLEFSTGKIKVKVQDKNEFEESYEIFIENSDKLFGDWEQPAEISGKVVLKFKISKKEDVTMEKNNKVPRKFDLRNENAVTPVKNQYKDGACRSFASLGALESFVLKETGKTLDLSENNFETRHGFYLTDGSKQLRAREGRVRDSDLGYLISGLGPISETDDPYRPFLEQGIDVKDGISKEEYYKKTAITDKEPAVKVTGFEFLKTVDTKKLTSEEDEKLLQIKEAIKNYGAVVTDIYMAHDGKSTFPYSNATYYNSEKFAYYADGKDEKYKNVANHAVTVVGWDDNFSKDNFITKPNIDGAWIVKDAQGETFGDKGYFYVSYASVSMTEQPYVFNKIAKTDEFNGIYQKDLLPFTGYASYNSLSDNGKDGKTIFLNKFTENEIGDVLTKIGFATTKPNAEFEIYFIQDFDEFKTEVEDFDSEDDFNEHIEKYKIYDNLMDKDKNSYAGYHTVDLKDTKLGKNFEFTNKKPFALGIWVKNSDDEDKEHKWDIVLENKTLKTDKGQTVYWGKNAEIKKDETYSFTFDGFTDVNKYSNKQIGNACIKGYYLRNK